MRHPRADKKEGSAMIEEQEMTLPIKCIVLIELGLLSFCCGVELYVHGKKGAYRYDFAWSANLLTFEWSGSLWNNL